VHAVDGCKSKGQDQLKNSVGRRGLPQRQVECPSDFLIDCQPNELLSKDDRLFNGTTGVPFGQISRAGNIAEEHFSLILRRSIGDILGRPERPAGGRGTRGDLDAGLFECETSFQ
jgi:hypothetical protein